MDVIWILVIGAIAGIFHQIVDRAKENTTLSIVRGLVVGIGGALVTWYGLKGAIETDVSMMVSVFIGGYFGDSILLNAIDRLLKDKGIPAKEREKIEETVKEAIEDDL